MRNLFYQTLKASVSLRGIGNVMTSCLIVLIITSFSACSDDSNFQYNKNDSQIVYPTLYDFSPYLGSGNFSYYSSRLQLSSSDGAYLIYFKINYSNDTQIPIGTFNATQNLYIESFRYKTTFLDQNYLQTVSGSLSIAPVSQGHYYVKFEIKVRDDVRKAAYLLKGVNSYMNITFSSW